jgi:hypothetical protein
MSSHLHAWGCAEHSCVLSTVPCLGFCRDYELVICTIRILLPALIDLLPWFGTEDDKAKAMPGTLSAQCREICVLIVLS